MGTIIKILIGFFLAYYIFYTFDENSFSKKPVILTPKEEKCPFGKEDCKFCDKKHNMSREVVSSKPSTNTQKSLFSHKGTLPKKVVFKQPEELKENEVSAFTKEGKIEAARKLSWLVLLLQTK